MAHEIETAMFVNAPAWHGLGTILDHPPTIEEAIIAAGLDYRIDLEPMFLLDGTEVDERHAVVRSSDRKILGTVGEGFRITQNIDAFRWFQPMLDAGLVELEAAGALRGGSRMWVLAKVKGPDAVIVPKAGDTVRNYLLLAHGHDGTLAHFCGATPTRVVCQNTLSAAIGEGTMLKIRHTKGGAAALEAAQKLMAKAIGQFHKATEVYKALAGVYVTAAQLYAYIDAVFPPAKKLDLSVAAATQAATVASGSGELASLLDRPVAAKDGIFSAEGGNTTKETRQRIYGEIETLFTGGRGNDVDGVRGTAWGAYNAVTEYITHERGRTADTRVNTAWFGAESPRAIEAAVSTFLK